MEQVVAPSFETPNADTRRPQRMAAKRRSPRPPRAQTATRQDSANRLLIVHKLVSCERDRDARASSTDCTRNC
eukprot:8810110-Karenia_brevis.AAC.1